MNWLPALRWNGSWWRLPLSSDTSEFLAALWLDVETANGPLADREWAVLQTMRALSRDPALFLCATLQHCAEVTAAQGGTIELADIAAWLCDRSLDWFSDGSQALLGEQELPECDPNCGPGDELGEEPDIELDDESNDHSAAVLRWTEWYEQAAAISRAEWLSQGSSWLSVWGPEVPRDWQAQWPEEVLFAEVEREEGTELPASGLVFRPAVLDLRRWARQLRRGVSLEQRFAPLLQEAKLSSLRQLAYGLTHEINNPLANIRTRAEQLVLDEQQPARRQRLERIVEQAMRAHEMIADLMYFARPPALRCSEWDPVTVARQSLAAVESDCQSRAIRLTLDAPRSGERLVADSQQVLGALLALLRNSMEAIGERGAIVLQVRWHRRRVEWLVADSGEGMSEEVRQHAFDPYFSGREAGRGLGLGLSRVYRVAKSHGGGVSIEGGPIGCCIRLWIPLRPPGAE